MVASGPAFRDRQVFGMGTEPVSAVSEHLVAHRECGYATADGLDRGLSIGVL
jgi:hypothetical protein